ncbi:hypothetical protein GYMLUDRAFT_443395 [Collybiopsis luxurians FD-317 M1]|uniref:Acyl-CoA desaturase n=1 Tax=Collybiopsis luxurians FD-317 M1 TaxID=944289 RepID=A0A0D0CKZ8_9AGAR|nr:hypothetical protein GYMLUDRAFT_443395 [Collybiopsis luxurians FD-317 M1]
MDSDLSPSTQIWWSNGFFFISVHLATLIGLFWLPPTAVPYSTLVLAYAMWQLAEFGITIGYHRLWSHSAFRAKTGVRVVLAALGSAGFQGSIKWWCLRHRLHHRFTDDPVHDPYAATRGLLYSHMGWIFYKPTYTRLKFIDREDLDRDPIVRLQHKFYIPIALFFGFVLPTLIGSLWKDPVGGFLYGGLVARLAVWHCTFLVNSLAHFHGLQPFSDEDTSRGNILLAVLTSGEGNHNFHHAFPHDYRSSPWIAWDPSSAVILLLHRLGLVNGLRQARIADLNEALAYMSHKSLYGEPPKDDEDDRNVGKTSNDKGCQYWTIDKARLFVKEQPGRCIVLLDGWAVDVTAYLGEHPGGASLLRKYALGTDTSDHQWREASWAFDGGLNNHSRAARRRVKEMRVARIKDEETE